MAHPVIEEIGRVFTVDRVQTHAFRRWQRILSTEIQPMLDERERLLEENAALVKERDYYLKLRAEENDSLLRLTRFASERCDLSDVGGDCVDWAIKQIEGKRKAVKA